MSSRNQPRRILKVLLRVAGLWDMLALGAMLMARWRMEQIHAQLGMGPMPSGAVVDYLTRSAALLYGVHGIWVFFVSFDVDRYWRLITMMAWTTLGSAMALAWIDTRAGLPNWWRWQEPAFYVMAALVVFALQSYDRRLQQGVSVAS